MASAAALQRLQQRAVQAESLITKLRGQLASLHNTAVVNACRVEEEKLRNENNQLKTEVEDLKQSLVQAEIVNGVPQVSLPGAQASSQRTAPSAPQTAPGQTNVAGGSGEKAPKQQQKKKEKKEAKPKQQQAASDLPLDVSRLDMRIGQIVDVKKHPDADSLYVEEVDLGEGRHRTVVSGLVNHIPIEQMQDRIAIFMVNLKPAKMRGVLSEAMIMCGSTPEKVEIIVPPEGVQKGDCISVEGFSGTPDAMLNPKKKVWEQVQPDLKINENGLATYKGVPWKVAQLAGSCSVPSLRNVIIK